MWFKLSVVWWTDLDYNPPDIFNTRFTWFTPQVVWADNATTSNALEQISTEDPLESINGDLVDKDFNARIHQILETVESLELSTGGARNRQETWMKWRVDHGIQDMSDAQLKDIVMATELGIIKTKPVYFTALCEEIMERVIGTVARIR